MQTRHSAVQHVGEKHKKNRLTSNVRKGIQNGIWCDERWILRQIINNTHLRATKLAAEKKIHLHKNVNPEIVRGVLRKMIFIDKWPGTKVFISQKNLKFRNEFADNHLQKGSEFWKRV
jgi:hypothetical protein